MPKTEAQKRANKKWAKSNPDKVRAGIERWRAADPEHAREILREGQRRWRKSNPEKAAAAHKKWAQKSEKRRKYSREYRNERRRSDPKTALHHRISIGIRKSIRSGKDRKSWTLFLGYSAEQLRIHIERQFTRGMSWAKLLAGEIEIDHIRPVAMFSFTSPDDAEFKDCWSLTNLRPMWAADNLRKSDKRELLL